MLPLFLAFSNKIKEVPVVGSLSKIVTKVRGEEKRAVKEQMRRKHIKILVRNASK